MRSRKIKETELQDNSTIQIEGNHFPEDVNGEAQPPHIVSSVEKKESPKLSSKLSDRLGFDQSTEHKRIWMRRRFETNFR